VFITFTEIIVDQVYQARRVWNMSV